MIKNFKELIVWQKSMELTRTIYSETSAFPKNEEFSLTSQLRRSAVSVPSNISEGFGRKNPKEFNRFLNISFASLAELETQVILSHDFKYISSETFAKISSLIEEIAKMIRSLQTKLKNT